MSAFARRRRRALGLLAAVIGLAAASGLEAQAPRWQPHVSVHAGAPQLASVGLGVLRVVERSGDFTQVRGPRLVLEPGVRAGKARLGWAVTGAYATGYAIEAAALRDWDDATTLFGGEVHGTFMFIDAGFGVFAGRGERRLALSIGLSL